MLWTTVILRNDERRYGHRSSFFRKGLKRCMGVNRKQPKSVEKLYFGGYAVEMFGIFNDFTAFMDTSNKYMPKSKGHHYKEKSFTALSPQNVQYRFTGLILIVKPTSPARQASKLGLS